MRKTSDTRSWVLTIERHFQAWWTGSRAHGDMAAFRVAYFAGWRDATLNDAVARAEQSGAVSDCDGPGEPAHPGTADPA